jgi:hypothetical protein
MPPVADENRRSSYRVIYPERLRPRAVIRGTTVPVLDCSETGLRYEWSTGELPAMGEAVDGVLRLEDGTTVPFAGTVVRIIERQVALALASKRIPFAVILSEQRQLRARYLD